jgi:hypothetical protein
MRVRNRTPAGLVAIECDDVGTDGVQGELDVAGAWQPRTRRKRVVRPWRRYPELACQATRRGPLPCAL